MKKSLFVVLALATAMAILIFVLARLPEPGQNPGEAQQPTAEATPANTPTTAVPETGYRDATYEIEGTLVTLVDGVAEQAAAPGSSAKITTQYFGNIASGDLNGDGKQDAAFILTHTGGGGGTFFYVVAALQTDSGYRGSNAVLLGDRIAPQTTSIKNGIITVNYAERNPGEPFTTPPSLGKSMHLEMIEGILMETQQPAEITGQTWHWVKTQMNDDTLITPAQSGAFTINFAADGRVYGTTDCNNFTGSYTLEGDTLTFGALASTKKFCPNAQEGAFLAALGQVQGLLLDESQNQLALLLAYDSGSMIFAP